MGVVLGFKPAAPHITGLFVPMAKLMHESHTFCHWTGSILSQLGRNGSREYPKDVVKKRKEEKGRGRTLIFFVVLTASVFIRVQKVHLGISGLDDQDQNSYLNASWMLRGPPPPRKGLPMPTSGVTVIGRNP